MPFDAKAFSLGASHSALASPKQKDYLRSLIDRNCECSWDFWLESASEELTGRVCTMEDLTKKEASQLIDYLRNY